MKFTLTFKTPGVLDHLAPQEGLDTEFFEEMNNLAKKFVEWSEYIRIEFDTETQTATVLHI